MHASFFVGKNVRKQTLGRLKRKWEDNIKMYVKVKFVRIQSGWKWLRIMSGITSVKTYSFTIRVN